MSDAFHIMPGDEVSCYECARNGDHTSYKRGEAFLVEASHYPYNGSANYFCKTHLSPELTVWEPLFTQLVA